jgi:hypothetical protein
MDSRSHFTSLDIFRNQSTSRGQCDRKHTIYEHCWVPGDPFDHEINRSPPHALWNGTSDPQTLRLSNIAVFQYRLLHILVAPHDLFSKFWNWRLGEQPDVARTLVRRLGCMRRPYNVDPCQLACDFWAVVACKVVHVEQKSGTAAFLCKSLLFHRQWKHRGDKIILIGIPPRW